MKNLLFIFGVSLLIFSCSSDGLEDTSKTEEPFSYKNGNLSTGKVSSTGLVAPTGFEFSEIPAGSEGMLNAFYLNWSEPAKHTVSDDFIIPPNESWKIDNFSFFIMNPDILPNSTSYIKTLVLEIYDGDPKLSTSKKVYGNMNDNLFKSITSTNIYRVNHLTTSSTMNQQAKLVYKVDTSLKDLNLQSGRYWYKMTLKFNYGDDWFWFVPRLPVGVNDVNAFNAYYRFESNGDIVTGDQGFTAPGIPVQPPYVKYETPFEISGIKTIN
ncbi:hypothetical protein LUD75_16215 [Epilithonimonas sp. JDS]|uniref:hypothetical protein n=1 Tax=Epilithonimonas sp. JDS TaxID=2902797 RepID=UPI001E3936A5|nr:hypothetical protein [Epilithonimonas sp. JDS]MCD9856272.1 hypothetical protein [Epilithonimonas sp. JDS]